MTKVASGLFKMVRFPAGGLMLFKESVCMVVPACVGGVFGGEPPSVWKSYQQKRRYVRRERDLPRKERIGWP